MKDWNDEAIVVLTVGCIYLAILILALQIVRFLV